MLLLFLHPKANRSPLAPFPKIEIYIVILYLINWQKKYVFQSIKYLYEKNFDCYLNFNLSSLLHNESSLHAKHHPCGFADLNLVSWKNNYTYYGLKGTELCWQYRNIVGIYSWICRDYKWNYLITLSWRLHSRRCVDGVSK